MKTGKSNSFNSKKSLQVQGKTYHYYHVPTAANAIGFDYKQLPFSLRVVFENLIRYEDGETVKSDDAEAFKQWLAKGGKSSQEIMYRPARVLMQDFTGVPAVVDLAAMRDAILQLGGDPTKINPLAPVDLVIDHSVQVDAFGNPKAFNKNVEFEVERNRERYTFLRWGQEAFNNFRVVPPGTGICHQVNLEYLAQVAWTSEQNGETIVYPDTLVGTDSHTTMINGLAVLGWGVGGIEAEAAMLGQPISMLVPEVVGFKLTGKMTEGTTATDLVLTITQMLRERGVVGKFVEFFGPGMRELQLADRATIANMAPEYGATCGFFPIDEETINYMKLTSRDPHQIELVEAFAKEQGLWHNASDPVPVFTDTLELDLGSVQPSLAGPKRPQDRVLLSDAQSEFAKILPSFHKGANFDRNVLVEGRDFKMAHGDVVIAAITSCTNTSNPSVMMAAGLVAKKARENGLTSKPWVKTSLAPGSKVVTEYLERSNLQQELDAIGFNLVGYGCTTCIGNSGPLEDAINDAVLNNDLTAVAVLSGNRNFEGRIHPLVKANYLASPPLVVAYALAGTMNINLTKDPIAKDNAGNPVYLKDIWPTNQEIRDAVASCVTPEMFKEKYSDVFAGDEHWQAITSHKTITYNWDDSSYINNPPYFKGMQTFSGSVKDIKGASVLAMLGDSVTTDHISPAGSISKDSPAAKYLSGKRIEPRDFNSYGSRRGNHEVMMRGTFANIRIRNEMAPGTEGGMTTYIPSGQVMSIYDASMEYQKNNTPLVVVAGKEYGTGSSRDWAAKGTLLLGVKAVIAESFERIHRSNLVGMGVLPLTFKEGQNRKTLRLDGTETFDIMGIEEGLTPGQELLCRITRASGETETISLLCRLDTANEVEYYENSGILHYVIRSLKAA